MRTRHTGATAAVATDTHGAAATRSPRGRHEVATRSKGIASNARINGEDEYH